jgi:enoyl-CoA hydratase
MTEDPLLLQIDDAIATITLNRPAKLNALLPTMLALLERYCAQIEDDLSLRAVIVTGAGAKAFCVGADIGAWSTLEPLDMWRRWIREGHRVFTRLARLRQPVIAAIHGYALGGGLELALAADLRLAASDAHFALPETGIGTVPGWGGTHRLPALIGGARAKQLIFTGERIDARTAERWGLVNEVTPPGAVLSRARELATRIASRAPIAVQLTKQALDGVTDEGSAAALEAMAAAVAASTADGREGVASFREHRTPDFHGK